MTETRTIKVSRRLSRGRRLCPVCKKHQFIEKGKFEICPICGWEDDPVARQDPAYVGGANKISLEEARERYLEQSEKTQQ